MPNSFHYAFKVKDLESTRQFYCEILGCKEGRSTNTWVDFDFFGHQLSAHIGKIVPLDYCGEVDGITVPIPHFGCILTTKEFASVQHALEEAHVTFLVKPQTRYKGKTGQQETMFVLDYSQNPIEFKSFYNTQELFAKH